MINLHQLLKATVKQKASDLLLISGSPPALRISGKIVRVKTDELTAADTLRLCESLFTEEQQNSLDEEKSITFSFGIKDLARFRVHVYYQRGTLAAVFRHIPIAIPELGELGFSPALKDLMLARKGLIIITGPKSSGRSTTAAAMIGEFNQFRRGLIATVENPIEFVHTNISCLVSQQEVNSDIMLLGNEYGFLKNKNPDLCFLGDLSTLESYETALSLSEQGCLVLATMHYSSVISAIQNFVDVFPVDDRSRIQKLLAQNLNAVVSQQLVASAKGPMVMAQELLFPIPEIKKLLLEQKYQGVTELMKVNHQKTGMMVMNQSLLQLVLKRTVDMKEAFAISEDPEELDRYLKNAGV